MIETYGMFSSLILIIIIIIMIISMKIELVEFEHLRENQIASVDDPHTVLQNIYNPMPGEH